ncbi:MAG: hypothetical protein K2Q32_09255 [Alphaproteobacteria bacterium]|nr:hypothetical protein [Alphaproteobacteria bacterium]
MSKPGYKYTRTTLLTLPGFDSSELEQNRRFADTIGNLMIDDFEKLAGEGDKVELFGIEIKDVYNWQTLSHRSIACYTRIDGKHQTISIGVNGNSANIIVNETDGYGVVKHTIWNAGGQLNANGEFLPAIAEGPYPKTLNGLVGALIRNGNMATQHNASVASSIQHAAKYTGATPSVG